VRFFHTHKNLLFGKVEARMYRDFIAIACDYGVSNCIPANGNTPLSGRVAVR
jgi:hypothetical protein